MRLALPYLLRHAALALPAQQRPAVSMSKQRLLQGDPGPFAPCLQAQMAAHFEHGEIALEAYIVERAPGGNGGSAQDPGGDAARRRSKRRPKPRDENRA